jgi:hypothetical protein
MCALCKCLCVCLIRDARLDMFVIMLMQAG